MVAVFVSSAVVMVATVVPSMAQSTVAFEDVSTGHPNEEAIVYLKSKGVIKGYGDGKFLPDTTINRAEFMKIIVGSSVTGAAGKNCFSDVKEEWFAPFVCEAKKRGIVQGYPDGSFKPALNINAVEASKIVAKAFELKGEDTGAGTGAPKGALWFAPFVTALEKEKAIPITMVNPKIPRSIDTISIEIPF